LLLERHHRPDKSTEKKDGAGHAVRIEVIQPIRIVRSPFSSPRLVKLDVDRRRRNVAVSISSANSRRNAMPYGAGSCPGA
jgi:hypothetical protein